MSLLMMVFLIGAGLFAVAGLGRCVQRLHYVWRRHWKFPPAKYPELWSGRRWAGPGSDPGRDV